MTLDAKQKTSNQLRKVLAKAGYRLVDQIGSGGMGHVYLAIGENNSKWAIKMLSAHLAEDPVILDRFFEEARIAATLNHDNIATVFHTIRGPFNCIVMRLIPGEDLVQRIKRQGKVPPKEVVTIALQVLSALEWAHEHLIVHRDLKPSNIRVSVSGTVYVLDFGIARALDSPSRRTALGETPGTPLYMSPEQIRGVEDVDERSDLYSLGVLLYETLSGANPFDAGNNNAIRTNHLELVPPPLSRLGLSIPNKLSKIIMRLLEKDPDRRYRSAAEVAAELRALNMMAEIRPPRSVCQPAEFAEDTPSGRSATPLRSGPVSPTVPAAGRAIDRPLPVDADRRRHPGHFLVRFFPALRRFTRVHWLLITGGVITCLLVPGVLFLWNGTACVVQVDASPYADVTIRDDKTKVIHHEFTPFRVDLQPGRYGFEFSSGTVKKSQTVRISRGKPNSVRMDFWDEPETVRIVESYSASEP